MTHPLNGLRCATLALALAFPGLAVRAQDAPVIDPGLDVNGDRMFSFPEMQTRWPDLSADVFTTLDASGDGLLDATEVEAALADGTLAPPEG